MAVTNGWGQAAKNNTNGYGKLATNNIGAGSIYEDSWAGDTALIGVTAGFSYSKSSYKNNEADPTPTITGTAGGTFSAGSGLVFVDSGSNTGSSTGQIDLSATTVAAYTITYTVSGVSSNVSLSVTQAFINDYSMLFDGTNDYIQAASTSDAIINFQNPWSVSWWAKWTYTAAFDCFWQFGSTSAPLMYVLAWVNGTGIGWQAARTTGTASLFYNLGGTLNDGDWHHFVFTGDGTTTDCNVYIDGSLNTETPTSTGATSIQVAAMNNIGRGYATTGRFFNGNMDSVAIWDTALGATEVTELYNSGTPIALDSDTGNYTSSADLQAWYRMGD